MKVKVPAARVSKGMRASEVYRRAAEFVAEPGFAAGCCRAIALAEGSCDGDSLGAYETKIQKRFARFFHPQTQTKTMYWWELDTETPRVLALLLMSEIARDEERKEGR